MSLTETNTGSLELGQLDTRPSEQLKSAEELSELSKEQAIRLVNNPAILNRYKNFLDSRIGPTEIHQRLQASQDRETSAPGEHEWLQSAGMVDVELGVVCVINNALWEEKNWRASLFDINTGRQQDLLVQLESIDQSDPKSTKIVLLVTNTGQRLFFELNNSNWSTNQQPVELHSPTRYIYGGQQEQRVDTFNLDIADFDEQLRKLEAISQMGRHGCRSVHNRSLNMH